MRLADITEALKEIHKVPDTPFVGKGKRKVREFAKPSKKKQKSGILRDEASENPPIIIETEDVCLKNPADYPIQETGEVVPIRELEVVIDEGITNTWGEFEFEYAGVEEEEEEEQELEHSDSDRTHTDDNSATHSASEKIQRQDRDGEEEETTIEELLIEKEIVQIEAATDLVEQTIQAEEIESKPQTIQELEQTTMPSVPEEPFAAALTQVPYDAPTNFQIVNMLEQVLAKHNEIEEKLTKQTQVQKEIKSAIEYSSTSGSE